MAIVERSVTKLMRNERLLPVMLSASAQDKLKLHAMARKNKCSVSELLRKCIHKWVAEWEIEHGEISLDDVKGEDTHSGKHAQRKKLEIYPPEVVEQNTPVRKNAKKK